jgi:MFS family permease
MNSIDAKKDRSLRFSFLDGIFASAMIGFTQDYFTPLLLLLGGTARHVGILNALPNLFSALMQLKSADLVEKLKSRRKIINIFVFLQALMFLPMVSIALIGRANLYIFIAVATAFAFFGAFAMPAWGSLMADLVDEDKRGRYFGWRNRSLGFIIVVSTFLAGVILHVMKKINIFYGFVLIFGFAFIFRVISWYFLTRMHEPHLEYKKENSFTLFDFLARIKESNFARFVLFIAMMHFSVNLVSPFFAVLMLRDLRFSYMTYSIVVVTATVSVYIMIGRWGHRADRVGNLRVIKFVSRLIAVIPLLWVINRNPLFLISAQVFSGFAWAGFNLCATNFIYDAVTPPKRTRCIAYFNVFNGVALCMGALIGGFLLHKLPTLFGYKILTLCLISSFLRFLVAFFMPARLKEVRPVEKVSSNQLFFSMIGIRPRQSI